MSKKKHIKFNYFCIDDVLKCMKENEKFLKENYKKSLKESYKKSLKKEMKK